MADFSIDIDSLTGNDQVTVNIGTSAGASDVAQYQYTTTGTKAETFTPTAATMWIDIVGEDTAIDSHTIDVDNVSVSDGGERITNGDFASDVSSWTEIVATVSWNAGAMRLSGFGATQTTARQSFATSFAVATSGAGGGCRHHHCADGVVYGDDLSRARYERMMGEFEREAEEAKRPKPKRRHPPRKIRLRRPAAPADAMTKARAMLQRESEREARRRQRGR